MSRAALIVIVAGIIIAAIAAGVVAITTGRQQAGVPEGTDATEGRQLALNLNENLALKENP